MDKETLRTLYLWTHRSQRQIAKEFGVSQTTVAYYLRKYNIKRNQRKPLHGNNRKECTKCKKVKKIKKFYRNEKGLPGSWCKFCLNKATLHRQHRHKRAALEYCGGAVCSACGYANYIGALEFHHLDPDEKELQINRVVRNELTDEMKEELDKCAVLCSNCHREVHGGVLELSPD